MFRALTFLLTAAIGLANPAIAQYGGLDTTAKEATPTATNLNPTPAEKTITLKRSLHPIQK
jgi:hypothetical protein